MRARLLERDAELRRLRAAILAKLSVSSRREAARAFTAGRA
jgi:hypothetical protein